MKSCNINGCDRKFYAKGFCVKHYKQNLKHGKTFERTRYDPNEIVINGNIAEIVLCNNKNQEAGRTIIDVEDIDKVADHRWHIWNGYAATNINGRVAVIQNVIMDFKPNRNSMIDHRDRDKLNNRKENFRFCTNAENCSNVGKSANNTSGYKGVYWGNRGKRWVAYITANRERYHIGYFKDRVDAAIAYNKAALKYHGEFACLNSFSLGDRR